MRITITSIPLLILALLLSACGATPLPLPSPTATSAVSGPVPGEFPNAPFLNADLPKDGLVLATHRYGDDTCYDVGIYQDDSYMVISCLANYEYPTPGGKLDESASFYLHRWIERYSTYETASAQDFLKFSGKGSHNPDDAEQISIDALLRELEFLAHNPVVPFDGMSPSVIVTMRLLEQRLGRELGPMNVRSTEQVEFSDTCLGLPRQDEICVQVATPGMKIGIVVDDLMYVFHTDYHGFDLRMNGAPIPAPTPFSG